MEKDFIIDQVSWHTGKARNYDFDNSIIFEYFKSIIKYLQNNRLTSRIILSETEEIKDDFCFKASDLTEEGFALIKKVYDKWVDNVVDKKISPTDYKILDKKLKSIKSKTTK